MTLCTAFTKLFSLQHPIALAPMGGSAGGALAAAVSEGGGLGLVGGGRQDPAWLDRELAIVADRTAKPWGVGFLAWAADVSTVERALARGPRAVMLSFGDPRPFVQPIRRAGSALIIQVTDLDEAKQAIEVGADVIVAQALKQAAMAGAQGDPRFPSCR
jgi:nitronate monooxygenase